MRPSQYTQAPGNVGTANDIPREASVHLDRERISMEHFLLGRRWFLHCASPLFHFHSNELSEYAHDLVKTLRANALRTCGQQFGYTVSIQNTATIVAFDIYEDRNKRRSIEVYTASAQTKDLERSGSFVLYLPTDEEQHNSPKGQEKQQVILLRGDAELLDVVRFWLQHRFQCVVGINAVHMQQLNLKCLAHDLTVASLIAEDKIPVSAESDISDQEAQADLCCGGSIKPAQGALLLKYRATKEADVVRTYTMTVPWATLRRLFQETKDCSHSPIHVPELIELVERLYFDSLPFDLSTYKIERIQMQQVAINLDGGVELYSMDFVSTVLSTLLEVLAVQSNATSLRPEMTL